MHGLYIYSDGSGKGHAGLPGLAGAAQLQASNSLGTGIYHMYGEPDRLSSLPMPSGVYCAPNVLRVKLPGLVGPWTICHPEHQVIAAMSCNISRSERFICIDRCCQDGKGG